MIKLRDYQEKFLSDIREAFRQGAKAPLAQGPTGMGKTVILTSVADGATKIKNNIFILLHRQELIIQTSEALAFSGVPHHICAPSKVVAAAQKSQIKKVGRSFYQHDSLVLVASVQTLVNRMADYPVPDLILIDEAHHGVAGTWLKIVQAYPKAKILGVTATPERLDGKGLGKDCGGIFDNLILGPSIKWLIERGYLSRPRVFAPPMQMDLDGIKTIAGDYSKGELNSRVNKVSITGDAISHYRRLCNNVPAIAFCVSVEHAQSVAEQFKLAGYKAACIDGTMDDASRRATIESLANGNLHVLTSCEIVSEGTDIPVVGAAILLRPTKSLGLYLQQVGRALRPYPGKEYTVILDHVGNVDRHGLPDEDREWSLQGRKKRNGSKKDAGGPATRQCVKCYAIFPTTVDVCPLCGREVQKSRQEIEQIEAELVEVEQARLKTQFKIEKARAKTLEELVELGKRKGYDNPHAWARYVLNGRRRSA